MTLFNEKTLANFVPAAAVIRKGLVLFKIIGRKTYDENYCYVKMQKTKEYVFSLLFKQIIRV